MKKALIHDWYYTNGGAEKVIHSLNNIWPDFDHYGLVDFLNDEDRSFILNGKNAQTSFIQGLPTAKSNHRKFLQLFPYAIEQFNLNSYELVLSSSSSIAKGVLTNQNQLHICYCHSPVRYAWDLYHNYLEESRLEKGLKGMYAKYVLHKIRNWDVLSSNRVDYFIANSNYIAGRIKKIYGRESKVIYPPVNTHIFTLKEEKSDFYFSASRLVPYKRLDVIIEAFNAMPEKKLFIAGSGPEYERLKNSANSNVKLLGFIEDSEMKYYLQNAKAFVYAAEEDFGILPVEAQACGTPVICFSKGGLKETVIDSKTGIHFNEQTSESLQRGVRSFESLNFNPIEIRKNALQYGSERFEREIKLFVEEKYIDFKNK